MNRKIACVLLAAALSASIFSGCGGEANENPSSTTPSKVVSSSDDKASSEAVEPVIFKNPLSGEIIAEPLTGRPVTFMVNNVAPALPQRGIQDADVIYEAPVEGGVTRLLAVFSDYKELPEVGSIRSARHDFVELAKPFNPIFVHIGASTSGFTAIADNKIENIDGREHSSVAFYKDEQRAKTKNSEHCWFSTGELVQNGIEKLDYKIEGDEQKPILDFVNPDENVMDSYADAVTAASVSATTTGASTIGFEYDQAEGRYAKKLAKNDHIDENYNSVLKVKNVFLMYTDVSNMADDYHKEIDLSKGSGYYISEGKGIDVTFNKEGVDSFLKVFDKNGDEIKANVGNSYFVIMDESNRTKLKME